MPETKQEQQAGPKGYQFATVNPGGRKSPVHALLKDEQAFAQVLQLIRQGCFDHVAAQAIGIAKNTWFRWMRQGEQDAEEGRKTNYRTFWTQVTQARAQARVAKELQAGKESAQFWLKCGPGKTKKGDPGWTESVAVVGDGEADPIAIEGEFVSLVGYEEATPTDLAQTLLHLAQLGLLEGLHAKEALLAGRAAQPQLAPPSNGEEDDDDDEDPTVVKGYNPERGLEVKDVTEIRHPHPQIEDFSHDLPDLTKDPMG